MLTVAFEMIDHHAMAEAQKTDPDCLSHLLNIQNVFFRRVFTTGFTAKPIIRQLSLSHFAGHHPWGLLLVEMPVELTLGGCINLPGDLVSHIDPSKNADLGISWGTSGQKSIGSQYKLHTTVRSQHSCHQLRPKQLTFSPSLASITSRGHCGEAFSGSCSEWGIRTSGYEAASQRAVRRGSSYNTETMSSQHSWRCSAGSKEREHLQETKNSSGCKSNQ